ncbi:Ig-like domain-containing protein [Longimicrobium sp.]|uniref:Ig-like domain-containing protein n=1 Tax=Longimicrobium sp. TaxID=2029185 RepID=UPI003B3BDD78
MQTGTSHRTAARAAHPLTRLRAAAGALALSLAAACVDDVATGPQLAPPPDASGPAAALVCHADVRAGTLECAPPAGAGGASAVILAGQGIDVRLRSSNLSYDGVDTFRVDVTVENLTRQALGTHDAHSPYYQGIRVFFANGPTSATGAVEVANATGEAFFTAAGQKYFQYPGLLAPGDTTTPMQWRFSVPPTVSSFQFGVYVSALVPHESGWLRMEPFFPSLAVGESMPLHAHPHDVTGRPIPAGTTTWSSADSTVARVAADGTVTGVAPGETFVFATNGARTGLVQVRVSSTAGDVLPPTAHELTISPVHVAADGLDSLTLSVRLTDKGSGTRYIYLHAASPSGIHFANCYSVEPTTGTRADGTFTCRAAIPPHAEGGVWHVTQLSVVDRVQNSRTLWGMGTLATIWGGVSRAVYVRSPTPDVLPPTFTSVAFTPDSIEANGLDSVTVSMEMQDAGSGVTYALAAFRAPAGALASCDSGTPFTGTPAAGVFRCRLAVPAGTEPGTWTLESVETYDATGNFRRLYTAELAAAGYATTLRVSGPPADTTRPALTGFTFSPRTVAANGLDSVTVVVEITDHGSGAERVQTDFVSPSGQRVTCYRYGPSPQPGTTVIPCRFAVGPGRETGEWRIDFVWIDDANDNNRAYFTEELEALGFPVTLTVTP